MQHRVGAAGPGHVPPQVAFGDQPGQPPVAPVEHLVPGSPGRGGRCPGRSPRRGRERRTSGAGRSRSPDSPRPGRRPSLTPSPRAPNRSSYTPSAIHEQRTRRARSSRRSGDPVAEQLDELHGHLSIERTIGGDRETAGDHRLPVRRGSVAARPRGSPSLAARTSHKAPVPERGDRFEPIASAPAVGRTSPCGPRRLWPGAERAGNYAGPVPSMNDLVRSHTDLDDADLEWLHLLWRTGSCSPTSPSPTWCCGCPTWDGSGYVAVAPDAPDHRPDRRISDDLVGTSSRARPPPAARRGAGRGPDRARGRPGVARGRPGRGSRRSRSAAASRVIARDRPQHQPAHGPHARAGSS